jgi:hypothetical protein
MRKDLRKAVEAVEGASQLLHSLRDLIQNARQRALRAVDAVQVQTCWEIGRHIVEFEQGGSARAEYGARFLQTSASSLTSESGKGFDVSNLRYLRQFYNANPIRDALRHELSWTHYRTLLPVEDWRRRGVASARGGGSPINANLGGLGLVARTIGVGHHHYSEGSTVTRHELWGGTF